MIDIRNIAKEIMNTLVDLDDRFFVIVSRDGLLRVSETNELSEEDLTYFMRSNEHPDLIKIIRELVVNIGIVVTGSRVDVSRTNGVFPSDDLRLRAHVRVDVQKNIPAAEPLQGYANVLVGFGHINAHLNKTEERMRQGLLWGDDSWTGLRIGKIHIPTQFVPSCVEVEAKLAWLKGPDTDDVALQNDSFLRKGIGPCDEAYGYSIDEAKSGFVESRGIQAFHKVRWYGWWWIVTKIASTLGTKFATKVEGPYADESEVAHILGDRIASSDFRETREQLTISRAIATSKKITKVEEYIVSRIEGIGVSVARFDGFLPVTCDWFDDEEQAMSFLNALFAPEPKDSSDLYPF